MNSIQVAVESGTLADAGLSEKELRDWVNNALTLLAWAVKEVQSGREIVTFDKSNDTYRVLTMQVLENAKRNING